MTTSVKPASWSIASSSWADRIWSRSALVAADAGADGDISRTCVRNLRLIGDALAGSEDIRVRVAIPYAKSSALKWGLALGLVGGVIAAALDSHSRGKLQGLLDEGGLRDSEGTLLELAEARGWQIELV
jgi:hypothetical protein